MSSCACLLITFKDTLWPCRRFGSPASIPGQSSTRRQSGLGIGFPHQYHSTNVPHSYTILLPQMLDNFRKWRRLQAETLLSKSLFKTTFFGKFRLYSDFFALFTHLHLTQIGLSTLKTAKHVLRKTR